MRAIQNYYIKFKPNTLEFFDLLKNRDAIYNVLEYTARYAAVNFEESAKVESVNFLDSNIMQVVIDLPHSKDHEITDTLTVIARDCSLMAYCDIVNLTDE